MSEKYIRHKIKAFVRKEVMADGSSEFVVCDTTPEDRLIGCKTQQAAQNIADALNKPNVIGFLYEDIVSSE